MKVDYRFRVLIALVLALQGLSVAMLGNKLTVYLPVARLAGFLIGIIGLGYLLYLLKSSRMEREASDKTKPAEDEKVEKDLGQRLIDLIGLGRSHITFPIYGMVIILAVILFNFRYSAFPELQGMDGATILMGVIFIVYHHIPRSFEMEKRFALLFFIFLFLFLILPLIAYPMLTDTSQRDADDTFSQHLLARPLAGILNTLGIESEFKGNNVKFEDEHGVAQEVSIAVACSGIYSTMIFASAFVAFVLVEYRRFDLKVGAILGLGVFAAYLANLLRMTIIIMMGYYNGMGDSENPEFGTLLWGHAYLGWLIFMIWIAIFWFLMFKFLIRDDLKRGTKKGEYDTVQEDRSEKDAPDENEPSEKEPVEEAVENGSSTEGEPVDEEPPPLQNDDQK